MAGFATGAYSQPVQQSACGAARLDADNGFFVLRMDEATVGLPATAEALQRFDKSRFTAIIVPAGWQASSPADPRSSGTAWLRAAASRSGSALVRADIPLSIENVEWNRREVSIVTYRPPSGGSHALAAVVVDRSGSPPAHVALIPLSLPEQGREEPGLDAAAQEYLYTLAFRQEAVARYCWPSSGGRCGDDRLLSQREALQQIARQRECALAKLPEGARARFPRWRLVTLRPTPGHADCKSAASVQVFDEAGPLAGVQVIFSKQPHSGCTATSQADGTATCELVDAHGHDEDHPESEQEGVVATFPGDLRGDPILLPTTEVLPRDSRPVPHRPSR